MAKKISKNKDVSRSSNTLSEIAFASPFGLAAIISLIILVTLAGSMDSTAEKWTGLLSSVVILVLLVIKGAAVLEKYITPLFFTVAAYILWSGISTFYAASGKFAIFEFSKLLVAFCVYLISLFFTRPDESGFKQVSYILAVTGCFYGVISVSAASSGILSGIFKSFFGLFTEAFRGNGVFEQGIRITGIFGNPNIYAGFMALAVLISLNLVINANDKKNSLLPKILLAVNSLAYLLAFSLGSLFMFAVACLLMIAVSDKSRRVSLFILMLETAVLTFFMAFLAMAGLGKTGAVSFVSFIAIILNALLLVIIDDRVRPVVANKLNANKKLLSLCIIIIITVTAGYLAAAFTTTGSIALNQTEVIMRAIYVEGGDYSLDIESSDQVNVSVESQNEYDLMRHSSSSLFSGSNEQAIKFTVPDNSKIVMIYFSSQEKDVVINSAQYHGTEEGRIHLNYPLLPGIIANRLQNLFANENMVQRTIFFEDGLKLFSKSPLIGRGLGGFENGVYSVQDFFYETKYAHNHYIQVLSDLGIVGVILYLSLLAFAIISLIQSKQRGRSPYAVPLLSACIFQIFGQALTDAIWSMGVTLCFIAAVLAAVTIFCTEPIKFKSPTITVLRKSERIVIAAFTGMFVVLLSGNLYAQAQAKSGVEDFKDIERLVALDRFEYNDYKLSYINNAV